MIPVSYTHLDCLLYTAWNGWKTCSVLKGETEDRPGKMHEVRNLCDSLSDGIDVYKRQDEDLVHEIAWALEVNGPVYTAGEPFMRAMDDREFRASEIPIPLHDGAKRYYEEQGYFK